MSELRELMDVSLPFALDDSKNYIYIKDAKKENTYYCPCCGKQVNTIAITENVNYTMPPHFRHYPNQTCTSESLAHWVYKMWLFEKGSQFYVYDGSDKKLYYVDEIQIEKAFKTDFGEYRPDITIDTACGKRFYFELNFSSPKRGDDYYCKWSFLNNDVIEIDVKKLLKESLNNKIPIFRLIYSDGICYDDKYTKKDIFANTARELFNRKEEIKRQDMLNYKTIWEKLDWFWDEIKKYKSMKSNMNDLLKCFSNVPYEEMEMCFNIVRRISCINNNQGFRDIINKYFEIEFNKYFKTTKHKLKGICKIDSSFTIKRGCFVDITVDKKYSISQNTSYKFFRFYENKKWQMFYSYFTEIKNEVDEYINQIPNHIYVVGKINEIITWDKYPLFLYDVNFNKREKGINLNFNNHKLLTDFEETLYMINNMHNDIAIDDYYKNIKSKVIENFCNSCDILQEKYKNVSFKCYGNYGYYGSNTVKIYISSYGTNIDCLTLDRDSLTITSNLVKNMNISFDNLVNKSYENITEIISDHVEIFILKEIKTREINMQNKEIKENFIDELIDSSYCKNAICTLNDMLIEKYNLKCSIDANYYNDEKILLKYDSTILNSNLQKVLIDSNTLNYIIINEVLCGYILNNLSSWINSSLVKTIKQNFDFIKEIDKYNNKTWDFYFYKNNRNYYIDLRLNYKNTFGYEKYAFSKIFINETLLSEDYTCFCTKIKELLTQNMKNLLDNTIDYYNSKNKNIRMLISGGITNDK